MRASMAAGRSVASWNSAVERDCPERMPSWRRRSAELVGADRASGLAAGEQPGRGALVADGGVASPGGGDLEDEGVERLGKDDWLAAEPEAYLVAAGLDVARG